MAYFKETIDMPVIIGANDLEMLQTWVDVAYTIHQDIWGYTEGVMLIGCEIIHKKCAKQKIKH